ncbi:MAG: hypothetical protein ACOX1P_27360 [Thermoguttaceae bacterium]|jgi:hypothetical protein
MKKRRFLLAILGVGLAIVYAAALSLVTPGQHSATVRRGALLVLVMGCYGWCFGGERWLATRWLVLDLVLMPLALAGAAITGVVFVVGSVIRWLCSLVGR